MHTIDLSVFVDETTSRESGTNQQADITIKNSNT